MYTNSECLAILNYARETPPYINMFLRSEISLENRQDEYITLINAFSKNKTSKDMIAYRGIDHNYFSFEEYFINLFLISTTDELINALHFTNDEFKVVLKIHIPSDTPIINIGDIDEEHHRYFVDHDGGEDILLPGLFKVTDVELKYTPIGYQEINGVLCEEVDFNKPYYMITCNYKQLETIEEVISRIK